MHAQRHLHTAFARVLSRYMIPEKLHVYQHFIYHSCKIHRWCRCLLLGYLEFLFNSTAINFNLKANR